MSHEPTAESSGAAPPTPVPPPAAEPATETPGLPAVRPKAARTGRRPRSGSAGKVGAELRRRRVPKLREVPSQVWHRVRRGATEAVLEPPSDVTTPPPVPPIVVPQEERVSPIMRLSPFSIGFTGAAGALVAVWLFQNLASLSNIILIVVVSLFLALGLNPIVEWLSAKLRLRRWLGVTLVMLGVITVFGLGSWALFPLVAEQVNTLISNFPNYVMQLRQNETIGRLDAKYHLLSKINEFVANPSTWTNMFGGVLGASKLVANTMASLVIGLVLTIYFLSSLPQIKNVIYQMAPKSKRPRAQYLANEMFRRIGGYLTGMFVVMTCAATCAFVMMQFVGLSKYSFALAFITMLLSGVPLVGSLTAMCIVALVALTVSPMTSVIVIIYFLCYQQFEAYVLQPRVMARSVNVPGAIVVVAAFAGGSLIGIVGALIAIPTAAALLLLYREVLIPQLDRS